MDLVDTVKLICRRWIAFGLTLLVLGGACVYYVHKKAPTYKASATVAFVAQPATGTNLPASELGNPLSPTDVAIMIHDKLVSPTVAQAIAKKDGSGYTLGDPTTNDSPVMQISATSTTPSQAVKVVEDAIAQAQTDTEQIQQYLQVPSVRWITVVGVTGPGPALPQSKGKVRSAAALGALALIVSVMVAFLAESLATRRQTKLGGGSASAFPNTEHRDESGAGLVRHGTDATRSSPKTAGGSRPREIPLPHVAPSGAHAGDAHPSLVLFPGQSGAAREAGMAPGGSLADDPAMTSDSTSDDDHWWAKGEALKQPLGPRPR